MISLVKRARSTRSQSRGRFESHHLHQGQVTGLRWDAEKLAKRPERYLSRCSGRPCDSDALTKGLSTSRQRERHVASRSNRMTGSSRRIVSSGRPIGNSGASEKSTPGRTGTVEAHLWRTTSQRAQGADTKQGVKVTPLATDRGSTTLVRVMPHVEGPRRL